MRVSSSVNVFDQAACVPAGAPTVRMTIVSGPGGEGESITLRRVTSLFGAKAGCKVVLRHPLVDRRHCVWPVVVA